MQIDMLNIRVEELGVLTATTARQNKKQYRVCEFV